MEYILRAPINKGYTPTQQILTNRGIKYEDIDHYLNVTEQDNLNPLKLKNIREAAQMLCKHLNDKAHIHVVVDCDYDGYASSALLLNYLYRRLPSIAQSISYSLHEGKFHGIELESLPPWTTLVIAPDSSSNQYEIHEELSNRGIDVLVLDHHIAEKESEYACVVNNQLCDYPTKSLCGTAIVYKLCQYIDSIMEDNIVDEFIDLAGTALVADMVDQRDYETHYLTQRGLGNFRNPFIKGMAQKNAYSLGDTITPTGVAFYIVPLVNAVVRVGTIGEKKLLFESMLEWKANELIPSTKRGHKGEQETVLEQSLRTCTNVKNRQTKNQDAAIEQIEEIIKNQNLNDNKVLAICVNSPNYDRSITGLIANQVMAQYQKPTIILSPIDEEFLWSGSARACGVDDFRQFCKDSGLVEMAQGHPLAHGISIYEEKIPDFIKFCNREFANKDFSPSYKVDYIYSLNEVKPQNILEIGGLKTLWGQNMEEPLVAIENISVTKEMLQLMAKDRNPTLKITLPNEISCIKFKSSEEEFNDLYSDSGCVVITIVGKCNVNEYLGSVTAQIIIVDYEIVERQKYYF